MEMRDGMASRREPSVKAVGGAELDSHAGTAAHAIDAVRRDHLTYVGDMAAELQQMADRMGCRTLAGLLALAAMEAELERSRS